MAEHLFTILLISLYCCGLYQLTEDGNLLGFIGRWYEGLHHKKDGKIYKNQDQVNKDFSLGSVPAVEMTPEELQNHENCRQEELSYWENKTYIEDILMYLFKPVFGCVGCMASVWGTYILYVLYQIPDFYTMGLPVWLLWLTTVIPAIFTNFLFYNIYKR